jgi:hypothetical protein
MRIMKLSVIGEGASEFEHCRRRQGRQLNVIEEGAKLDKHIQYSMIATSFMFLIQIGPAPIPLFHKNWYTNEYTY